MRNGWHGARPAPWLAALLAIPLAIVARPVRADEKAEAILARCRAATAKLKSLKASLWLTPGANTFVGTVTLKRPNKAWIQVKGWQVERIVSDGKAMLIHIPSKQQCLQMDPGPDGSRIPALAGQIEAFFQPQNIGKATAGVTTTYAGRQKFEGAEYEVVELVAPAPQNRTWRYFISPDDFLLHRIVVRSVTPEGEGTAEMTLKSVQIDPPVGDDAFVWTPPADAVLVVVPSAEELEKKLIPVGKPAPAFSLAPVAGGSPVSLADAVRGKKAVLVVFWSLDSPVSRAALPAIDSLYRKFQQQGLAVLGVDRGDDAAGVAKYVEENLIGFRILTAGSGPAYPIEDDYGVAAHPALYLLGADGRVLWRAHGFDEEKLAAALASVGMR